MLFDVLDMKNRQLHSAVSFERDKQFLKHNTLSFLCEKCQSFIEQMTFLTLNCKKT